MDCLEVGLKAWIFSPHCHPHTSRFRLGKKSLNQKASLMYQVSTQIISEGKNFRAASDPTSILSSPSTLDLSSLYKVHEKTSTVHEVVENIISGTGEVGLSEREISLRRSLRVRRETVQELLIEALKGQKLGSTFCNEMVKNMQEFVDHIMIECAALRKSPEYANAPFSFRVRIYIEKTKVAKTIRLVCLIIL